MQQPRPGKRRNQRRTSRPRPKPMGKRSAERCVESIKKDECVAVLEDHNQITDAPQRVKTQSCGFAFSLIALSVGGGACVSGQAIWLGPATVQGVSCRRSRKCYGAIGDASEVPPRLWPGESSMVGLPDRQENEPGSWQVSGRLAKQSFLIPI